MEETVAGPGQQQHIPARWSERPGGSDTSSRELVGFWRRLAALAIDWIILGLIGNILGQLLFDPLASLGSGSRVFGFAVAVAYFGLFDSGLFDGCTPGKRALQLRVVDRTGRAISLPRSMVRAALLSAPFVFNGMILVMDSASLAERAFGGLMGGWAIGALYLAACNRATRQGVHDLAAGSYLVRNTASTGTLHARPFWRPHALVAAMFIGIGVPAAMAGYPVFLTFTPVVTSEASLLPKGDPPEMRAAWMTYAQQAGSPRTCQRMTVLLRGTGIDDAAAARQVAAALARRVHCRIETQLAVRMFYEFNLGFAAGRRYRDHVLQASDFAR